MDLVNLFNEPAVQAVLLGTLFHFLSSVANALIPNESDDAPWYYKVIGKTIRGLALGVGNAVPKKAK